MEEIFDIIVSILWFLLRTVVFAFYSIFLLVGGIFSPALRRQLKERWGRSGWEQASMITGTLVGVAIIFVTFAYIVPAFSSSNEDEGTGETSPPATEQQTEAEKGLGESLRDKAIDQGAEYLKKKLRKEE